MEYFDTIDWSLIWNIIKDIVLPHTGTLILNTFIFYLLDCSYPFSILSFYLRRTF